MIWLRSAIASLSVFSPTPYSRSPGTGITREMEPSATISWSYGTSRCCPSAVATKTRLASGSAPVTWPSSRSVRLRCSRSGTTTCRGSSVPAAAPGSSGV